MVLLKRDVFCLSNLFMVFLGIGLEFTLFFIIVVFGISFSDMILNFVMMVSFTGHSSDEDSIDNKGSSKSEFVPESKLRNVDNISSELNKLVFSRKLLRKAKKKYNRLYKVISREALVARLNIYEDVLKNRDVLAILICYIEHFGKFQFAGKSRITSNSRLESISIFVSAAHKEFLWYVCLFEGIGTWCGGDLSLRRDDIDDLFYELRIDASTGLDRVISRIQDDGLIGYKLKGRFLEYCELKGWIMNIKDIGNLSESRLYGLMLVTFDVEQYSNDFGIKFELVSARVAWEEVNSHLLERWVAVYDVLIQYIGISCIRSKSSIRIKGWYGMRLFLAKWGFSLIGGPFRICRKLCYFYGVSLRQNQLVVYVRSSSLSAFSNWSSTASGIEDIRFERYRISRARRMELIHKELWDDFKCMRFDFNSQTLGSFYSIWSFSFGIEFTRDWGLLDKEDLLKCTAEDKKIILEDHKRFVKQKKESSEARNKRERMYVEWYKRGNESEAAKFKDGVEYTGSLDRLRRSIKEALKYQVGYLSPSSYKKVGSFKHERLANYYVGMRDFYGDDDKEQLD